MLQYKLTHTHTHVNTRGLWISGSLAHVFVGSCSGIGLECALAVLCAPRMDIADVWLRVVVVRGEVVAAARFDS